MVKHIIFMKVYTDINKLPHFDSSVITLGSFDGIHIAHKKIIDLLNAKAREYDTKSVVISFSPHPRMVLSQDDTDFKLLTTDEEKIKRLEELGVDVLLLVPFTVEFSRMAPREYVEKFICSVFNPKIVLLGYDHRFGLNREGNIDLIRQYEQKCGFKVLKIDVEKHNDKPVSSTIIRNYLLKGNLKKANLLLGRNYSISGVVIHGNKLGRKIGFRTANLKVDVNKLIPKNGVYAAIAHIEDKRYNGMVYIGIKHFGDNKKERVIEINIFDFNENIYGQTIEIEIIDFIRPGIKFTSEEQIITQLNEDKESVKLALEYYSPIVEKKKDIAIVILNYNGIKYLEKFLNTLLHNTDLGVRYIIADNASTDDSVNYIRSNYPEIEVYEMESNYGFSEGYNRAIKSLKDLEYIVFLNSDVEITEHWLEPVIDTMQKDKTIAIAQPKILAYNTKDYFEYAGAAGGYIDSLAYPFCRGRIFDTIEKDEGQYDDTREVFWASGAAMVMRKEVFDNFKGFDPDFFAHQEEIDLAWRVKRAGYKVMAIGETAVYHVGGGTLSYVNPMKTYLNFRNNMVMILKNDSFLNVLWKFPTRLILDGIAGAKFLVEKKFSSVYAIIKAHFYVYFNIFKIIKKRNQYNKLIKKHKIGEPRKTGIFSGLIIKEYYLSKKQNFKKLDIK